MKRIILTFTDLILILSTILAQDKSLAFSNSFAVVTGISQPLLLK